jgi:hypothetical protein
MTLCINMIFFSWNTGSRRNTNQFDEEEDLMEIDFGKRE